ncbi:MAG: tRNA 2-selenouridine(34) synthase MnmH, partial [Clostridium sp.]
MKLETTTDFQNIVLNNVPLIDTRAPIEFIKGAFENSVNLPIMTDEERHLVGICYKEKGNEEAVKLGHKLVCGDIKEERLNGWKLFIENNPNAMIYCFRGGSRSTISQEWISTYLGKDIIKLNGGYKAFRNYLINELSPEAQTSKPIILAGLTGTGKTNLLKELENSIDLERIANHRGSAFGGHTTPQPTQINFENNLAYELIKHRSKGYSHIILEDEGGNVGANFIPKPLAAYFKSGDLVIIESSLEDRVSITLNEYVINSQKEYITAYKSEELGLLEWFNYIANSITRVKKKLGGDRF